MAVLIFTLALITFFILVMILGFIATIHENKLRKINARKEYDDFKQESDVQAMILCQNETTLPRIPKGDFCYLIAGEDKLIIKTKAEPIMTYELDYDKIYLFKSLKVKKIRPASSEAQTGTEYTVDQIAIQYVDDDSSIKELTFVYGDTKEDKAFNLYAFLDDDIFEAVNQKIPQRGNTVKL